MRSDIRHLHSVNVVVSVNHAIEPMLPVHCHKWISLIIIKKTSSVMEIFLFPASVFVSSIMYLISSVLCS